MDDVTSGPAVVVEDLTVGYNQMAVVHGLSITADFGAVTVLLGANGAGKTTTLLAIAGHLRPMGGTITVMGQSVAKKACHQVVKMGLSMVPEGRGLVYELTVAENLRLYRRRGSRSRADEVFDLFPALAQIHSRRAGLLSGGEQQMLALACAISAGGRILLIDELSHGLAPVVVERLLPTVRALARERGLAVLLVEQQVDSALQVADVVHVLSRGQVVLSGSAEEIGGRSAVLEASYLGSTSSSPRR
ncbi:MAG: ABC transporter ATP-binding protein [Acidimicrobiales bacterium]